MDGFTGGGHGTGRPVSSLACPARWGTVCDSELQFWRTYTVVAAAGTHKTHTSHDDTNGAERGHRDTAFTF